MHIVVIACSINLNGADGAADSRDCYWRTRHPRNSLELVLALLSTLNLSPTTPGSGQLHLLLGKVVLWCYHVMRRSQLGVTVSRL